MLWKIQVIKLESEPKEDGAGDRRKLTPEESEHTD